MSNESSATSPVASLNSEYVPAAADQDKTPTEVPSAHEESKASLHKQPSPEKVVEKKTKIDVLLKAAGDAPIMKKKKWAVDANRPIAYLIEFIRKYIKCEPSESLFLYVNQTFVPSPDQLLSNLFECFGTDGKLVLHYCKSQAWG
ncbi:autophagy protein 12-like [Hydractinia symbiolongicarpus]|uniref:autophagy protein 12-like n=1 Tax=Hydractinia symbiolongicarpus TaxID=13093 RepID=UPI002550ED3D|nr:autophagy protein 12-like [Hydractinia symbiolongicarpus]